MEKLPIEKQSEIKRMPTERLRAKLVNAGFGEEEVLQMERAQLLETYAEMVLDTITETDAKPGGDSVMGAMKDADKFGGFAAAQGGTDPMDVKNLFRYGNVNLNCMKKNLNLESGRLYNVKPEKRNIELKN
jgi:hypothetical protein